MAVLGALGLVWARGLANDVYCQIGLVMLIGLSAKNSILIVEFAEQLRRKDVRLPKLPLRLPSFVCADSDDFVRLHSGRSALCLPPRRRQGRQSVGTTVVAACCCRRTESVLYTGAICAAEPHVGPLGG